MPTILDVYDLTKKSEDTLLQLHNDLQDLKNKHIITKQLLEQTQQMLKLVLDERKIKSLISTSPELNTINYIQGDIGFIGSIV